MKDEFGAYTGFARVYDLFMDNVPYEKWGDWIERVLHSAGIRDGLVLDLGCGTGRLTRIMADKGYDMIGADRSAEMLEIAREEDAEVKGRQHSGALVKPQKKHTMGSAADGSRPEILYLQQDMREFELYGTVRAVYSACDSINYLMKDEELLKVFGLVNNYLDPGGIFIFDCNTTYKYEMLLGDRTFAENREDGSFIWENYYDPASGVNEYDLTLYIREGESYRRFEETHFQKNYTVGQIRELLVQAGMEYVAAYDDYTDLPLRENSERMVVVAREKGK